MTPTHRHNQSGLNHFGRDGLKPPQIADRKQPRTQLFEHHATTRSCHK
ncbi:hypothetical protein RESH_00505 [Rhodopirellula europaea SH398]|uniref:Uncharacterized protein n=1 Tax=Rhodopirellula europaea SH398 TaxID=1263868 RepID=M5SBY0_9BACT|nr:hypothetical protein RESH_00505 [Rhodopirellula europaea SH398]